MVDSNYKIGWQVACWSTLGVMACCALGFLLALFDGFDNIDNVEILLALSALSMVGIGVGNLLSAISLEKAGNPAGKAMKLAAIMMFVAGGVGLLGFTIPNFVASFIFLTASGVMLFLYKGNFSPAVKQLGLPIGMIDTGILIYAICICVISFSFLLCLFSWKAWAFAAVLIVLAVLGMIAGSIIWFLSMLKLTNSQK